MALQATFVPRSDSPALFLWVKPDEAPDRTAVRQAAPRDPAANLRLVPVDVKNLLKLAVVSLPIPDWGDTTVAGHYLPLPSGLASLATHGAWVDAAGPARTSTSLDVWSLAARLLLELLARQRIVPTLVAEGRARWRTCVTAPEDHRRFAALAAVLPEAAYAGTGYTTNAAALRAFLDQVADQVLRQPTFPRMPDLRFRAEWEWPVLRSLIGPASSVKLAPFMLENLSRSLDTWAVTALDRAAEESWRLCLKLDPPAEPFPSPMEHSPDAIAETVAEPSAESTAGSITSPLDDPTVGGEAPPAEPAPIPMPVTMPVTVPAGPAGPWILHYFLQAVDDPSLFLPLARVWAQSPDVMAVTGHRRLPTPAALAGRLGQVGRLVPAVRDSLRVPHPDHAELTLQEVWQFLTDSLPLLEESAVSVLVPQELTRSGRQRLRARLALGRSGRGAGSAASGWLALDGLVDFRYELVLGDTALDPDEFRQLVAAKRPLVHWKGQWIVVDPHALSQLGRLAGPEGEGSMGVARALHLVLAGKGAPGAPDIEVVAEGALDGLVERVRALDDVRERPEPPGFRGQLRPYQARGLAWLDTLTRLGLGALLADDMGLGKSVQVIAWLLETRGQLIGPALLVCPTSVLGNWQREISRFAPCIKVVRHHGPQRSRTPEALVGGLGSGDVLLTTYSHLRADVAVLSKLPLGAFILDEAHHLKNPASLQAQAARKIRAPARIALTGTPIENRLVDLWSLMDLLNRDLLGGLSEFQNSVATPIERFGDREATRRLQRVTRSFILRRVKTDPLVVSDLPSKNEMDVYCSMSPEQASLYQAVLDEQLAAVNAAQGIQRRGRVLALLTHLKQVLNHPAQYLQQKGPLAARSGKLGRLHQMVDEVVASGERALVFTQYAQMGHLLVSSLEEALGVKVPFLHGSVEPLARDRMVAAFQEDECPAPVFVLTLKAGGTGLNLTRANHVFHYDRWWNPAVEDQATDRAFRIGQTKSVQVHKFMTQGTVEEKIARLLEEKRRLAGEFVSTDESWITELSDRELEDLVSLSDAVVEDVPFDGAEEDEA